MFGNGCRGIGALPGCVVPDQAGAKAIRGGSAGFISDQYTEDGIPNPVFWAEGSFRGSFGVVAPLWAGDAPGVNHNAPNE